MPKAVSSNEAKQRWGSLLGYVNEHGDELIDDLADEGKLTFDRDWQR